MVRELRSIKQPGWTYLISISLSVCASRTMRRMHGGGVIGLRSWGVLRSGKTNDCGKITHLVTKSTHTSPDGLLHHL